jgi:AhpD family alkylhydroperoxidase
MLGFGVRDPRRVSAGFITRGDGRAPAAKLGTLTRTSRRRRMTAHYYDPADRAYTRVYKEETPDVLAAFAAFDNAVFATEGRAIPLKFRELIALGVALSTQCVYCIEAHSTKAVAAGATQAELAEAAWVTSALKAGGAFAHGRLGFKFTDTEHAH